MNSLLNVMLIKQHVVKSKISIQKKVEVMFVITDVMEDR